jgi:hypothetical protein
MRLDKVRLNSERFGSLQGAVMELSNYELVRYPSGQVVLLRAGLNAQGHPTSGPRDVVGAFTSETEARIALRRLAAASVPASAPLSG